MRFTITLGQLSKTVVRNSYGTRTSIATNIIDEIQRFSGFNPTALTLQGFVDFGAKNACPRHSYKFLRQELPVRLANIMQEFNHLPSQLRQMPSVELVRGWYMQSFIDLLEFTQEEDHEDITLERFTTQLDIIRNRHAKVVETMAEGVIELKEQLRYDKNMENTIQYFLDRFYMSRISIRMLIHQHLLLFQPNQRNVEKPSHVGCIDPSCDVLAIARDAYENARFLCEQYYMNSPECEFTCLNAEHEADTITVTYVPSHLYHILFELIKNALRAVVEYHEHSPELPKVNILICKGKEDLTIKLCDQGGGIPRSETDLLFNYMYSTAPRPPADPQAASTTPLAGYGYGLPLSRLYAKYFNGDLWLSSVEGFGTDAMVYLKVFPADASELLPVYNKTSLSKYAASIPVGDWSDPTQTTGLHGAVYQVYTPNSGNRNYSTTAKARKTPSRQYSTSVTPTGDHLKHGQGVNYIDIAEESLSKTMTPFTVIQR